MAKKHNIKSLFYITHIDNLQSILENGILSHNLVERKGIAFKTIYNPRVVSRRREKTAPDGETLWDFANLYFQPRNPMMYQVVYSGGKDDIAVLAIDPVVLSWKTTFVTTGNAANDATDILEVDEGLREIDRMWNIIYNDWWNDADGSKRRIMAECLVPDKIPAEYIRSIFVCNHRNSGRLQEILSDTHIPIIPEPHMFFQPNKRFRLNDKLSLIDGDMFFSTAQTLTISVNTVGVMGKGLASRTKYQFPDVYVHYQDACRRKQLTVDRPVIYKREASLDAELADDPASLPNINSNKWFLLFATKRHWRDGSRIEDIEAGLQWLLSHYKQEGITSLAMPALGCGLGQLNWSDVGPLMCRYLGQMDIQVNIYLPREQEISSDQLTSEFLLR